MGNRIKRSSPHLERTFDVGKAWPSVVNEAALVDVRSPRKAAAPVSEAVDLPSTDEEVHSTAGIACKRLSSAERQVIHDIQGPDMVAVEIVRTITQPRSDRIDEPVVVAEIVGPREGVIGHELQAVREPMIQPNLQRVVVRTSVVAEVVAHHHAIVTALDTRCHAGNRISIRCVKLGVVRTT